MGQEIGRTQFAPRDFVGFGERLEAETQLFARQWAGGAFAGDAYRCGCELEAWLLDHNCFPLPRNAQYLARLGNPLVVPELSTFNVELNATPVALSGAGLSAMEGELAATWAQCAQVAHGMDAQLAMIGTLPTIRQKDLTLAHISPLNRYRALNDQVVRARGGRPIHVDILGREHLEMRHRDVMLEAATTSFQVHLQCPADEVVRAYNASVVLSAPLVGLAANAPFAFGHDLWAETRIPLFEQAVDLGPDTLPRVTFGEDYLHASPAEVFEQNLARYPVLLPILSDEPAEHFRHLRLHNGTIWRWNRLLIGIDSGTPHVRIEQRVMPAGPSILDMMANAAVYLGAAQVLASLQRAPEHDLSFADARNNFYLAALDGLDARIVWLDGRRVELAQLLREEVLPMANEGLRRLGIDAADRERYLDVARDRVRTRQNGATWQRAWCARHGRDWLRLSAAYLEHQRSGAPVHQWPV